MNRILILGGTSEAVRLANDLTCQTGIEAIYSLAGVTRTPNLPDCILRQGGFGGADGLASYMEEADIAVLVDATHPFAAQMAANARTASALTEIPLIKFLRPEWVEPTDAPWLHAATPSDAASLIQGRFQRVFLSSGLSDIADFAHLKDSWFLVRSVDPSDVPAVLSQHYHLVSRGPFDLASETDLMRTWNIQVLVTKNSGGSATAAKLEAARLLGIPVIMNARPAVPAEAVFDDPADVLDAIRDTLC